MENGIVFVQIEFMRNENVYRDEVLEKVKAVSMIGENLEVTLQMAAEYYEVNVKQLDKQLSVIEMSLMITKN
ncbi:hypothetical protein LSPCS325_14200 [Lysinibacillus sp. CTST325]